MKKFLIIFISVFYTVISFSQDSLTFYYNNKWKLVETVNEAFYYRKAVKISDEKWDVKDYYMNDTLYMEGFYRSKKFEEKHGDFIFYYNTGNIYSLKRFKNDSLHGISEWYFENGSVASSEMYSKGNLICIVFFDEDGNILEGEHKIKVFPEYPGGKDAIKKYISKNVNYPRKLRKKGIEGEVVVRFEVSKTGYVTKTVIHKSVHPILDKEAERIILSLPRFTPGKHHNLLVNVWYRVPITFKLND